jgi:hypothetical protein
MKLFRSRSIWIAAVVFVFSLLAADNARYRALAFPDESDYWTLAQNLSASGTFSSDGVNPSAYRPPLVAWILAPITSTGISMEATRPLFVIFFALTGVFVGIFLCRLFPQSALAPPLGTAFALSHPLYFFSAGNLYPQQILTPLLLGALILACGRPVSIRAKLIRATVIGLATGASLLASAPALFSLLPVWCWLLWEDWSALRGRRFVQAYQVVIAGLLVLLCVAPYLARNARNVHPGLYLSLNSGINLLFGNSPLTTPTSGVNVDISAYTRGHEGDSEFDSNRSLTQAAIHNLRENPGYYTGLYFRKLAAGFGNTVETVTHGYSKPATLLLWTYMALAWAGTLLLFLWRFRWRKEAFESLASVDLEMIYRFAFLVLGSYLFSLLGYAIFFTRLRFRIPDDVALAVLAAAGWTLAGAQLLPLKLRAVR